MMKWPLVPTLAGIVAFGGCSATQTCRPDTTAPITNSTEPNVCGAVSEEVQRLYAAVMSEAKEDPTGRYGLLRIVSGSRFYEVKGTLRPDGTRTLDVTVGRREYIPSKIPGTIASAHLDEVPEIDYFDGLNGPLDGIVDFAVGWYRTETGFATKAMRPETWTAKSDAYLSAVKEILRIIATGKQFQGILSLYVDKDAEPLVPTTEIIINGTKIEVILK